MNISNVRPFRILISLIAVLAAFRVAAQAEDAKTTENNPPVDPAHPLFKPLELCRKSREALAEATDYEAVFQKKEVVDKSNKLKETTMKLKLREEPFSVHLKFVKPNAGREAIYVQGKNNDKLMAHEAGVVGGLTGWIPLDPKSSRAMENNKYPVTMIGMKNLLDRIIAQWEKEVKLDEVEVTIDTEAKWEGVPCLLIKASHPQPRDEFRFQATHLYLETATQFPIHLKQYGFPSKRDKEPPVVEEYAYSRVKVNVGLKDGDFDHTKAAAK